VLKVQREQKDQTLILKLAGEIVEGLDFFQLIGKTAPDTLLNCAGITRMNSVGVKTWIAYFQKEAKTGTKLRFTECSPAVVEQLNLIMNFSCGGTVESVYVPFSCKKCKKYSVELSQVKDLKVAGLNAPVSTCKICGGEALFDDILEEYFIFLNRSGSGD
jgi:anti-anti-sigma regulatory factor